jgi:hypothetical protein
MATRKKSENSTNLQALEATIEQLRESGRLDVIDAARVRIALGLAAAVDAMPDNPTLWREYRAAEKALREESEAHGDPFDQLIKSLSAEIRDETKPKAKNPRS